MATIYLHETTTLTPEQYTAGLTDFSSGRGKLFGNSTDEYLKVRSRGAAQAASPKARAAFGNDCVLMMPKAIEHGNNSVLCHSIPHQRIQPP